MNEFPNDIQALLIVFAVFIVALPLIPTWERIMSKRKPSVLALNVPNMRTLGDHWHLPKKPEPKKLEPAPAAVAPAALNFIIRLAIFLAVTKWTYGHEYGEGAALVMAVGMWGCARALWASVRARSWF